MSLFCLYSGQKIHLLLFGGTRGVLLLIAQVVIVNVLEAPVVAPKKTPGMTATAVMTVTAMSIGRGTEGGGAGAQTGGEPLPLIGGDTIARVLLQWKIPRKKMIAICSRIRRRRTTTEAQKVGESWAVFSSCKNNTRFFYL
jgi:hypothetical protein